MIKHMQQPHEKFHIVHRASDVVHSSHDTEKDAYTKLIGDKIEGRYYHPDYSVYSDSELAKKPKG